MLWELSPPTNVETGLRVFRPVRIKSAGKVVFSQARTFVRPAAAKTWTVTKKLAAGGSTGPFEGLHLAKPWTTSQAEPQELGKSKAQVLDDVKSDGIAERGCADLQPTDIVKFATELGAGRFPKLRLHRLPGILDRVTAVRDSDQGV